MGSWNETIQEIIKDSHTSTPELTSVERFERRLGLMKRVVQMISHMSHQEQLMFLMAFVPDSLLETALDSFEDRSDG